MTPEGRIKEKIDAILTKYPVYVFKPVQFGLGGAGLDYHCVIRVADTPVAFFIEAKKPNGTATDRQKELMGKLRREFRCNVFIVDGPLGLNMLEDWLHKLTKAAQNDTGKRAVHAQY